MKHVIRTVCRAAALVCARAAFAFNPPTDTQEGVTLSIGGVAEKVAAGTPLDFTVTLKNGRAQPVEGRVSVWLNDDWQMAGGDAVTLSAGPGQSATATCSARARDSVLNALYPVHARLLLTLDGKNVELHPVALFEAEKHAATQPLAAVSETVRAGGVTRLDCGIAPRVFVRQNGQPRDLGAGFNGVDPASGTHLSRDTVQRGGVSRAGFAVHPPYRGGPGVTWSDFRLTLPAGQPALLKFHTALRDHSATEPASDGTEFKVFAVGVDAAEKELFSRFSAGKSWEPATVDLGAYAGQSVTLRLWTGPGPKNDTTCDQCYWGDPFIAVGALPALATETQWQAREQEAVTRAKAAVTRKPRRGTGAFRLDVNGQPFGAAVVPGAQGLTDGVIAFSDGERALTYRGFVCEIDKAPAGGVENGQPVVRVETSAEGGEWALLHEIARPDPEGNGRTLSARARIRAEGGALRIAWDMPGVARNTRGTPRFTRLGLGAGSEPVWRVYAGFGNVIEWPGAFDLYGGGFTLSTRHSGADYSNRLSLVQACDIFPDRLVYTPETRRLALETRHDAAFLFVPSAKGAFDAARAYREVCGFKKGPGVDALLGRVCLDQWGGDYAAAAKDLGEAARYGVTDAIFVKHVWQRWGYDYRLPEIYPPARGLEPFLAMRTAAEQAGLLFCPHDNYIDFYPDAEGYSYDRIVFHEDGRPMKAWLNEGRKAQSYRWLPHGFRPWLEANMLRMRDGFRPDSLFIDVFTAIPPFDYYDRAGRFYPRTRTVKEWRDAFDTCRSLLKKGAPMLSEAGADALIGSLDGGQADHFPARRWLKAFGDADRTPWHDMATHGKMVLFAGGLGPRYSADDWDDHAGKPLRGYGSDDYLSNTVLGGRNPMCDGPFSRRAVMTYWLLHDVCDTLARESFEAHAFGPGIRQQHTVFSGGSEVWANRGSNAVWNVADGHALPTYGFYVKTPKAQAGVVLLGGQRAGFAKAAASFFADARPVHNPLHRMRAAAAVTEGRHLGGGTFEVVFNWTVLDPPLDGFLPFVHLQNDALRKGSGEQITFQASLPFDRSLLSTAGTFTAVARIAVPQNLPAGDYAIRYGLFRPGSGERLTLRGTQDGNLRLRGGILRVAKDDGRFTGGSFEPEPAADAALELNVGKRLLDFGPLVTDGAFRLLHDGRREWRLIPLPGSNPFRAEIRLGAFGKGRAAVQAVEPVDASPAAQLPEWTQDGTTLRLACDGQAFAYRVVFK